MNDFKLANPSVVTTADLSRKKKADEKASDIVIDENTSQEDLRKKISGLEKSISELTETVAELDEAVAVLEAKVEGDSNDETADEKPKKDGKK
jgi:uncharacterized protein YaaN involved in tellurite resistance